MYPVNAASVQPGIHTSVRTGKKKGKRDVTGRSPFNGSPTPCLLGGAKQMRH